MNREVQEAIRNDMRENPRPLILVSSPFLPYIRKRFADSGFCIQILHIRGPDAS